MRSVGETAGLQSAGFFMWWNMLYLLFLWYYCSVLSFSMMSPSPQGGGTTSKPPLLLHSARGGRLTRPRLLPKDLRTKHGETQTPAANATAGSEETIMENSAAIATATPQQPPKSADFYGTCHGIAPEHPNAAMSTAIRGCPRPLPRQSFHSDP